MSNDANFEPILHDLLGDSNAAAETIKRLYEVGVLDKERGTNNYGYWASERRRDGTWVRVFRTVATVEVVRDPSDQESAMVLPWFRRGAATKVRFHDDTVPIGPEIVDAETEAENQKKPDDTTLNKKKQYVVRFDPAVHAPAALLARLIEIHRERLQRVAALRPEADELGKTQRGMVR